MAASSVPSASADAPAGPCGPLDSDLGWALGAVFRSYVKEANVAVADLPGGPRGYQVLAAAATTALGTQLALANELGIDRTVMTYLLDDLERAGLIVRQPDPADRRVRRVCVTEPGRTRLTELDERLRLTEDHLLSALDEADRTTFRDLLRRLATHANSRHPMTDACQAVQETGIVQDGPQAATPRRTRRR
ncbi:MarR family winged helix-turn-helix transcriptional regulator [Rugosimonospora acidiphila]